MYYFSTISNVQDACALVCVSSCNVNMRGNIYVYIYMKGQTNKSSKASNNNNNNSIIIDTTDMYIIIYIMDANDDEE